MRERAPLNISPGLIGSNNNNLRKSSTGREHVLDCADDNTTNSIESTRMEQILFN